MTFRINAEFARKGYEYGYSHVATAHGLGGLRALVRRYRLRDFGRVVDGNTIWFSTRTLSSSVSALCTVKVTGERLDLDDLLCVVDDVLSDDLGDHQPIAHALVVEEKVFENSP